MLLDSMASRFSDAINPKNKDFRRIFKKYETRYTETL